jgi:hypothetical protein
METALALTILVALFALRFGLPLLVTAGLGRTLNRTYERWE